MSRFTRHDADSFEPRCMKSAANVAQAAVRFKGLLGKKHTHTASNDEGTDGETAAALANMSPEERAAALANMSPEERAAAALASMSPEERAAALGNMSPEERAAALENMSPEERAAALAKMSPEEAERAAALANMTPEERAAAIASMSPEEAEGATGNGSWVGNGVGNEAEEGYVFGASLNFDSMDPADAAALFNKVPISTHRHLRQSP